MVCAGTFHLFKLITNPLFRPFWCANIGDRLHVRLRLKPSHRRTMFQKWCVYGLVGPSYTSQQ